MKRILVACECSGRVRRAFRKAGCDAWSCDLEADVSSSPFHRREDVEKILDEGWDLIIAFPPCTHLSSSGARHWKAKRADGRQQEAERFFMRFAEMGARHAIENPIGRMSTRYRKPDQIIQPWQFGHGQTKATCLWLKGLPKLVPTNIVAGRRQDLYLLGPTKQRAALRSVTFQGIADAMASQWAGLLA